MKSLRAGMGITLALVVVGSALSQVTSIIDSVHNLSAGGPGPTRATSEQEVCIFCHTPHNASPIRPLWNRFLPVSAYNVYSSNSLDAQPGQPTGSSKMCLSCHDGTIALGSVVSRDQVIQMAAGITTIPQGASNLGTDLSDDHPVSFLYDTALVTKDPKLVNPLQVPPSLPLDHNQELQCTTCHDAHDNTYGDFLVISNDNSSLCKSCHQISTTTITGHEQCASCHRTHSAPSGPYLLQRDRISRTCIACHDGSVTGAADIASSLNEFSVHDTDSPIVLTGPIQDHVSCADCHNPHTMDSGQAAAPNVHPNFGAVTGVSISGTPIEAAQSEYEVCFKCHGDQGQLGSTAIARVISQGNTRLEFSQNSISFHPVVAPGRNTDVLSLKPGWTEGSLVYCSDCHGSNNGTNTGGSGPNGVHGSSYAPLLVARYDTLDFTTESLAAYALCYQCHERDGNDGILTDASFTEHNKHVRKEGATCSTCHDPHGISSLQGTFTNNSHLINFDTTVVSPDPVTGLLKFEDTGLLSGRCFLSCHGEAHSPQEYAR